MVHEKIGKVGVYNVGPGFGNILSGGENFFFPMSGIAKGCVKGIFPLIIPGTNVSFTGHMGPKGLVARNVKALDNFFELPKQNNKNTLYPDHNGNVVFDPDNIRQQTPVLSIEKNNTMIFFTSGRAKNYVFKHSNGLHFFALTRDKELKNLDLFEATGDFILLLEEKDGNIIFQVFRLGLRSHKSQDGSYSRFAIVEKRLEGSFCQETTQEELTEKIRAEEKNPFLIEHSTNFAKAIFEASRTI